MPKVATRVDLDALLQGLAAPRGSDDVDGTILDAASVLLHRHGLAGLEVDDVAAASGVGRSTVYRRFTDRNRLIVETLARDGRQFLGALAAAVAEIDDPVEQVVMAFSAGLRVARRTGLAQLVRSEPMLLRLLTVDSGPLVATARDHLVALAMTRSAGVDVTRARPPAELLIRLAISFVVAPDSSLELDDDDEIEDAVRRHVAPLVRGF